MAEGYDYSYSRPSVANLKTGKAEFVCRYLSNTAGKNITKAEATALHNAGIAIVLVWETGSNSALNGYNAGKNHASIAKKQAHEIEFPDDRPIYFAVDFDATETDQKKINSYLNGAASVLGENRVGIYGGYWPVSRALDAKTAKWAWQTYAWSGGKWDSRAHIRQYENGYKLANHDVDRNRSMKTDYGQWKPPGKVTPKMATVEPYYLNVAVSKPITVTAGKPLYVEFDHVDADTGNVRPKGSEGKPYPRLIVAEDSNIKFEIKTSGIDPSITARLVEVDPKKKYAVTKEYEYVDGNIHEIGMVSEGMILYLEIHSAVEEILSPRVKAFWWE